MRIRGDMEPTKAPWASTGAELPRTAAPWARTATTPDVATAPLPSRPGMTGQPVQALIHAQPGMPPEPSTSGTTPTFRAPEAAINSERDLKRFLTSDTVKSFVAFILSVNDAAKGKRISDACHVSAAVQSLVEVLDTLSVWVDEIPPATQALRYGNPAFKQWYARLAAAAPGFVARLLPPDLQAAVVELAPYLQQSFGNEIRIDYGTGHETTFCALLYCLAALGVLRQADLQALVTRVFAKYLDLMRKVQTTYWLEPAGSHGVWGLDDYQFLPFIWGSAQLMGHPSLRPSSIHAAQVLEGNWQDYLYIACVRFTKRVKKGPLQETSPLINDISGVPSWEKVNSGMVKMYQVEVLSKFPIMQHFLLGSILPFDKEREVA